MDPMLSSPAGAETRGPETSGHVLVVDDDPDVQQAARLLLGRQGLRVSAALKPAEIWSVLATEAVDAILLDLNFQRGAVSGAEGFACLDQILAHDPKAVVIVVTGHSGINIAVQAMRAGARDFVMKPWNNARLVATVEAAIAQSRQRDASPDAGLNSETPLLGDSPAMARLRDLIRRAAPTLASVLIHGEAGTGKSLIARTLHRQSTRAEGPCVVVDLSLLPGEAAATRLFEGPDGGALEEAKAGALVLEEVSALPAPAQARLLHRLEQGGISARLIATTRRRPGELTGRGGLSEALLYRLNSVELVAPTLREREGDALILAEHFLRLFAGRHGRQHKLLSPEASDLILATAWPGDVRALRQAMERCVIFSDGSRYEAADLGLADLSTPQSPAATASPLNLAQTERALVAAALKRHSFNVSHAAKELGLTRAALYRRMSKHGL